jgi:hypothetical protein
MSKQKCCTVPENECGLDMTPFINTSDFTTMGGTVQNLWTGKKLIINLRDLDWVWNDTQIPIETLQSLKDKVREGKITKEQYNERDLDLLQMLDNFYPITGVSDRDKMKSVCERFEAIFRLRLDRVENFRYNTTSGTLIFKNLSIFDKNLYKECLEVNMDGLTNVEGIVNISFMVNDPESSVVARTFGLGKPLLTDKLVTCIGSGDKFILKEDNLVPVTVKLSLFWDKLTENPYDVNPKNPKQNGGFKILLDQLTSDFSKVQLALRYRYYFTIESYNDVSFKLKISTNSPGSTTITNPNKTEILGLNPGQTYIITNVNPLITESILFINIIDMHIYQFNTNTVIHEFMHVLGFVHTHQIVNQNPIRDEYWQKEKIIRQKMTTEGITREKAIITTNANYFDKVGVIGTFDYDSIMNYEIKKCDTNNGNRGIEIKKKYKLSKSDIDMLSLTYPQLNLISPVSLINTSNEIVPSFIKNNYLYIGIIFLCLLTLYIITNLKIHF